MKNRNLTVKVLLLILLSVAFQTLPARAIENPNPERIVALGDLHGDFEAFLAILRDRDLIDANGKWKAANTQLVIVGDYHDRGPDTRYIMDYFFELKAQANAAGGDLNVAMGNHEMMVLTGDLRYTTDEELESFQGFPQPKLKGAAKRHYEGIIKTARSTANQSTAPIIILPDGKKMRQPLPEYSREQVEGFVAAHFGDTKYAQWVRSGASMIRIGRNLFVHGGITSWVYELPFSVVNNMIKTWAGFFQGIWSMPDPKQTEWSIGDDGPLWDRTMAGNELAPDDVKRMLEILDVDRIIVGHSTKPAVEALYENRVFAIDTGNSIFYNGQLSSIEILNNNSPTVRYAKRQEAPTMLYKTLVCRYRSEQGKPCNIK